MTIGNEINLNAFKEKAEAGDANAQYEMAFIENEYADPIIDDGKRSLAWLEKAADHGHANAQLAMGFYFLFKTERELLMKKWRNHVNGNINMMPLHLGVTLAIATLFEANNDHLAFEWFKKSSAQTNSDGQFWLGYCYYNGIGVEQSYSEAFSEFFKAAEQGMPDAMFWLAHFNFEGIGVPKNDSLAFDWLMKSVANGCDDGYLMLGDLYRQGKYVEHNAELAFQWYEKAAVLNNALAQHKLSHLYLLGEGVSEDFDKAFEWEEKAAENGNQDAKNTLINLFLRAGVGHSKGEYDGKKFEINHELAFELYQKAANYGSAAAYFLIGNCYELGEGVDQNDKLAFEYYQQALKSGQNELLPEYIKTVVHSAIARYYQEGKIVEKNEELAKQYLAGVNNEVLSDLIFDGIMHFPPDSPWVKEVLPIRLAIHNAMEDFNGARDYVDGVFNKDEGNDKSYKDICHQLISAREELAKINLQLEEKNKQLQSEVQYKEVLQIKMQKLVEQFTHTLGNVIFPDTIYQVAERLKTNPECRKDVLLLNEAYHSEIIIKLQAELLRQRYANTNPEKFRQLIRACRRDLNSQDKSKSIADILDYAASRVTARFLNQHNASLGSIRDKILAQKNVSLDALRQQFEDDILLNKTLGSVEWINQYLRPFEVVELSPLWQKVYILAESHAEALLFGYFSEVLFNAFKYADHDAEKFLTVRFDETVIEGKTYLSCSWSNPMGNKTPNSLGTGKGLDAILEDLQQLNDTDSETKSLLVSQDDQQFQVTMFFQKDLLIDEVSMPTYKRKSKTE